MLDLVILVSHVLLWPLCLAIVSLILLQGGAGDLSSAFGGGGQLDSTLGVGASRKMAKVTGWMALVFFFLVLFLAVPYKGRGFSDHRTTGASAAAATPAPAPAASASRASTPVVHEPATAPATTSPVIAPVVDAAAAAKGAVTAAVVQAATTLSQAATQAVEATPSAAQAADAAAKAAAETPAPVPALPAGSDSAPSLPIQPAK